MTRENRQTVQNAMLMLFVTALISIPLALFSNFWISRILDLVGLAAIYLMVRATGKEKLRVSLLCGIANFAINIFDHLFSGLYGELLAAALLVGLVSMVVAIAHFVCLFRGTAEVMEEEGFHEQAQSGRFVITITVVMYVVTTALLVGTIVTALMANSAPAPVTMGGSIVLVLLSLAVVVIGIIALICRLSYFW